MHAGTTSVPDEDAAEPAPNRPSAAGSVNPLRPVPGQGEAEPGVPRGRRQAGRGPAAGAGSTGRHELIGRPSAGQSGVASANGHGAEPVAERPAPTRSADRPEEPDTPAG